MALQPNYPTVNIAAYGPKPAAANPWQNFWGNLTPGFMRPGANLDLFGRPLRGTNLGVPSQPSADPYGGRVTGGPPTTQAEFDRQRQQYRQCGAASAAPIAPITPKVARSIRTEDRCAAC